MVCFSFVLSPFGGLPLLMGISTSKHDELIAACTVMGLGLQCFGVLLTPLCTRIP